MHVLDIPGFHTDDCSLFRCDYATLAAHMRGAGVVADALIVDAPYSERTHAGQPDPGRDRTHRRPLEYTSWSAADVAAFAQLMAPATRGWMVSLTDSELAASWRSEFEATERLSFQPLPVVERGMTVRKTGDGPSSWATWAIVARPRGGEWFRWGTLPGAYIGDQEARKAVVGGKPLWAMRALVRDYSRPGDLVCDPCAGGGTTLVAALEEGRRAIGCEPDAGRYEIAVRRIREAQRPLPRIEAVRARQLGLGGES